MYLNTLILSLLSLSALGSTSPTPSSENINTNANENTSITASQIEHIAPKSSSCANPPAKGECATSATAARSIAASFEKYQVNSRAEQAAVIALMAFESDEFRYSRNHFPGVEGQGTRNMQSPTYNLKYAKSLGKIRDKVAAAKGDKGQILDLLLADKEYDFGSGAWFLTTQCKDGVREKLQSGSEEGWEGYVTDCVGTQANEGRKGYWKKAVEALGS